MTRTTRWTISDEKCLFKDLEPGEKFYWISKGSYWTKSVFSVEGIWAATNFTQSLTQLFNNDEKVAKIILIEV